MSDKKTVLIDVIGKTLTGKTTIISLIAKTLHDLGIHVEINWGLDGPPLPSTLESKVARLADTNLEVVITEKQAPRATSLEQKIEKDTAEKIAKWIEQNRVLDLADAALSWIAKSIREGEWRRDTSMDD